MTKSAATKTAAKTAAKKAAAPKKGSTPAAKSAAKIAAAKLAAPAIADEAPVVIPKPTKALTEIAAQRDAVKADELALKKPYDKKVTERKELDKKLKDAGVVAGMKFVIDGEERELTRPANVNVDRVKVIDALLEAHPELAEEVAALVKEHTNTTFNVDFKSAAASKKAKAA